MAGATDAAEDHLYADEKFSEVISERPKFDTYVFPDGQQYRELLLTLPHPARLDAVILEMPYPDQVASINARLNNESNDEEAARAAWRDLNHLRDVTLNSVLSIAYLDKVGVPRLS